MSRSCHRSRPRRRGVLLLIVLSLLVLFVLIGVTFIVVAGQYTKAAQAFTRHELKGDPPTKEIHGALKQLLRGTSDANTLLYRHNLLRDLYGVDGFEGAVLNSSYSGPSGHQFLVLDFADVFGNARPSHHYYSGSVLTLLDGQGRGHSTRVIRYQPPTPINGVRRGMLVIEAFEELPPGYLPPPSTRFVVNGKPFNGTGDGYNPMTGKLDDTSVFPYNQAPTPFPSALMPLAQLVAPYGDSDETWDAADYQNLFLARIPSTIPNSGVPMMGTDPLIPSFHRPFLVNYWMHRISGLGMHWGEPTFDLLRRYVVARPMPDAHPFFTGSNPAFVFDPTADRDGDSIPDWLDTDDLDGDGLVDHPLVQGPWDVDNDNDGIADSVWVDLGYPVKSTPDGRLYKPLFAILCVDLDGRLNVNAHGTREVLAMAGVSLEGVSDAYAAGVTDAITLGQGYGPAEIRLDNYFRALYPNDGMDRYVTLLRERYRPRYGLPENPPSPGLPDDHGQFPFPNNPSLLSTFHLWGLPSDYTMPLVGEGNLYLTPPDLSGIGGIYLDHLGQPRFVRNQPGFPLMGTVYNIAFPPVFGRSQLTGEALDDPYELDLVTLRGDDSTFGEDDLEELLRFGDLDTQMMRNALPNLPLPIERASLSRILGPLPHQAMSVVSRHLTTRSFDIPTLNATIPSEDERQELAKMADDAYRATGALPNSPTLSAYSIVELLTKRLVSADSAREDIERQIRLMIPQEVRAGGRMDLNRLFGNGIDDTADSNYSGYGVVDEPGEWTPGQPVWAGTPMAAPGFYGAGDPHYDPTNGYYSRQQFARHLYCLAMLAMEERVQRDQSGAVTSRDRFEFPGIGTMPREVTARRIAQWAINVVDFRDPDAIMTPFEYDADPFNEDGWNVDDDFRTADTTPDRRIVWGCESPELLITETLAFHDRRVRDTDLEASDSPDDDNDDGVIAKRFPDENADDNPQNNTQDIDATLDQFRIPQGSLFVELYATGNPERNNPVQPRELYNTDGTLALGRLAVDAAGSSPIWRIAVAVPDPDFANDTNKEAEAALLLPALLDQADPSLDLFRRAVNDHGMLAGRGGPTGLPQLPAGSIDRYIIFGTPGSIMAPGEYFYNYGVRTTYLAPNLAPGEYAVIGPRPVTAIGSLVRSLATPPINDTDPSTAAPQRIVLRPNGLFFYDLSGTSPQPIGLSHPLAKAALTIVAAADAPLTWSRASLPVTAPLGIGVNISEPMPNSASYYREPITGFPSPRPDLDPAPGAQYVSQEPASYYADLSSGEKTLPDVPFDGPHAPGHYPLAQPAPISGTLPTMTGTHQKFRVLLLQRLADPTRPWDAATNPYITVDSQPVDLTVFNGEDDSSVPPPGWEDEMLNPAAQEPFDLYDDHDDPNLNPPEHFQSRERGELTQTAADSVQGPNVWNPVSRAPLPTVPEDNLRRAYWGHPLGQTLGALNSTYASAAGGARRPDPPEYLGAPVRPIPWLTWNNRPYISSLELMLVPSSSPWRLPYETRRVGTLANLDDPDLGHLVPWGHLLNFFYENPDGPDPNFSALLDWTEVPSRFLGTQKWLSSAINYTQQPPELQSYAPPFNRVSRFRDPGKINVNTIPDQFVWSAVDNPNIGIATQWSDLQASLIGRNAISERPAFYGNPLRAAGSHDLMPLSSLETSAAEATLLRRGAEDDSKMLFEFTSNSEATNPQLHPYFYYHKLQRLGNLVTSHSNVFAVWITVGYFEVYPWDGSNAATIALSRTDPTAVSPVPDAAHPDGYQLGPELGSDTGTIKRHRAFYIIDRSIPVGYKPGDDVNVENTIVLRRFIE